MPLSKILSKRDVVVMLEIVSECVSCDNTRAASALADKMKGILGFEQAVYGLAKMKNDGSISSYETINFSYPSAWLEIYKEKHFHKIDPIISENFSKFQLQYWKDTYKTRRCPKEFISASKDFNLYNGYACGVRNVNGTSGSILSFSGKMSNNFRNKRIVEIMTPHLHQAFSAALSTKPKKTLINISSREIEVLNWLKHGKSSWDISMILSISESTVKFHVNNIMTKLDAMSRTHAVAIALAEGLIDIH